MKIKYIVTLFFLLALEVGNAQISEIDARVVALNNFILDAQAQGDSENILPLIETSCRLTRRAIGTVDTQVKIYFKRQDGMYFSQEEQRDIETFQAVMQKVELNIKTESYTLDIHYYFDEMGELILAEEELTDRDNECSAIVYYFKQQRIIKLKKTVWKYEKPNKKQTVEFDKISLADQMIGQTLLQEVGNLELLLSAHYALLLAR